MSSLIQKLKASKSIKDVIYKPDGPAEFISTECYTLDLLFSGRMNKGGIPKGKISMIAADSSLGKSFVGMKIAKNAQKHHGMSVLFIDTEFSFDPKFAKTVGIDLDNFVAIQSNSIEEVQKIITSSIIPLEKSERKELFVVIDSWGGLVTSKAVNDAMDGKDVTDMTSAKKKNSLARLLTGLGVTVFVVNQVYTAVMNMYDPIAVGGGKGIYFASSSIVKGTSKAKSKEGDSISGAIITAKTEKGRFAREHSKLKFLIKYEGGIHSYFGLLDDALEGGFVVKPNQGWYTRPSVPDDKKWREKEIWENSKEFWEPLLLREDFHHYFEKKYSFEHNNLFTEDVIGEPAQTFFDEETGEIYDQTTNEELTNV